MHIYVIPPKSQGEARGWGCGYRP